jgi:hypothetical protein
MMHDGVAHVRMEDMTVSCSLNLAEPRVLEFMLSDSCSTER